MLLATALPKLLETALDRRIGRDVAHLCKSADESAIRIDADRIKALEMGDIDDQFRLGDAAFGKVEERGAAGEQHGCGHGRRRAALPRPSLREDRRNLSWHHLCSFADRLDDMRIGAATAEIARHVFADFIVGTRMAFADAGNGGHDLARRAVAALEGVMLKEGGLDRMKFGAAGRKGPRWW